MITRKSPRELDLMRTAGRIVAECLEISRSMARPGVATLEVDQAVEAHIRSRGAEPAFKGYRTRMKKPAFPASICISVNEEVVHGIPGPRKFKEGDLVSLDCGARYKGYYGDAALTVPVGKVSPVADRLLKVGQESLDRAIAALGPGVRLSSVSATIEQCIRASGFDLVRQYVGHGIGQELHEEPQVPNFVSKDLVNWDVVIQPGWVLAIEPMVTEGAGDTEELSDHWTVVTRDRKLAVHFEHSVAVTETGREVLTRVG